MPLRIPRERRDAVPGAHAYRMERPRHRARAFVKRGIADPGNASVRPGRYGFGIGVPFGGVGKEFVERQAIGLHRTVDHWHPAAFGGSGGEAPPTFQFHDMSPAPRRRHTPASWSGALPGRRWWIGRATCGERVCEYL